MLSHAILALVVAAAPALAIPPPIFGLPVSDYDTELSVAYTLSGNTTIVQAGQLFGGNSEPIHTDSTVEIAIADDPQSNTGPARPGPGPDQVPIRRQLRRSVRRGHGRP